MGVHQPKPIYDAVKALLEIPEDEPIFIFRAQDDLSVRILNAYLVDQSARASNDPSWLDEVRRCVDAFQDWQVKNSDKVKRAD